jgi:hypothetical protein
MWTGEQVSLQPFLNCVLVGCSFCEAMPGSLFMANTAVSSADSVEVGRSALYIRYNSGPGHCPGVRPH